MAVVDLTRVLSVRNGVDETARLHFEAARSGVLSWNSSSPAGKIEVRLSRGGSQLTAWLPYAQWSPAGRRSLSPSDRGVKVETDVLESNEPFDAIDVRAPGVRFDMIAFATPPVASKTTAQTLPPCELDVPARSQYVLDDQRGWCSPASLSMLHAFHGIDLDVAATAAEVFDSAYGGTGNWAFNMAFSGRLGLRAAVSYLGGFEQGRALIENGLPIAISYSWNDGGFPGAPLEHSQGHLAVLRGFDEQGNCLMNDPAAEHVRAAYPRSMLERIWQRSGGVAYVVAPPGKDFVSILNA